MEQPDYRRFGAMVAGALNHRNHESERPGDPSVFIDLLSEFARECGIPPTFGTTA